VAASPPLGDEAEATIRAFTKLPGVGEAKARALYERGYASFAALADADPDDLAAVSGIGRKLADQIRTTAAQRVPRAATPPAAAAAPETDDALADWLSGQGGDESLSAWLGGGTVAAAAPQAHPPEDGNVEALRKWLAGEGELDEWLGVEGKSEAPEAPRAPSDVLGRLREKERLLDERNEELRERERELEGLRAEVGELRRVVKEELKAFRSGKFDPLRYVEEMASLQKDLHREIARRKQLEEEIDHIKKGSIAVIKYVKAQQRKAGGERFKAELAKERTMRKQLEAELGRTRSVLDQLRAQIQAGLAKMPPEARKLKERELALAEREATLAAKETHMAAREEAAAAGDVDAGLSEALKHRLQAELREKERDALEREDALKKRIIALEEEVTKYKIEQRLREEARALEGKPAPEVDEALRRKEQELMAKERSVLLREQEIQRLNEELQLKEDELRRLKEPLAYKEDEILRREEDLLYREKLLQAEQRKVEQAKALGGSTEELELKQRLEELKAEISRKEEEVRAKEKYLQAKMEELKLREQGLIEEEIEAREEERILEIKQEKVKTGTPRLDDLLLGGVPFGSNVSVYGPAFVGKEIIVNAFMAEGLRKGVPIVWVITDKMPSDIREEMRFVLPGYEEYEELGLVHYVDAYSRGMGSDEVDPYAVYIDDPTDYDEILKAVDDVAKTIKENHAYYRLAFRSISTLIAYLDPITTFRFLQPFAGRRKRDKAVSMYVIEKGMHGEQEIQMLGSVMDGTVEFKVEQLKSFLCIKGVCDVQSRAWIRYTYSKGGVSIGSFSLDHIK
jgi:KaiC/GvpD/RAD55 family RecA-like ATPase